MNKAPLTNGYKPGYVSVGYGSLGSHHADRTDLDRSRGSVNQLIFPSTRSVLWDHRPTGDAVPIHLTNYRNPVVMVEEKTLRLVHRFSQDCTAESYRCSLVGSLTVDMDGCGVVVSVDRLDTSRGASDDKLSLSQLSQGDVYIPCVVRKNGARPSNSAVDYTKSISLLSERCTSKTRLDLCHFLSLRANCSYHGNKQTFIFHLDFDLVTCATGFKATPVNPVPIVPSALSKNLSGPLSMSEVQGAAKSGYLTMDHTRKILLVLESDPKINSLPIVGVWISGVSNVHDPFVWVSCVRYIYNKSLQERVCAPPEPFLLVLYSPLHSKPEFYNCVPTTDTKELDYNLLTCHEVVQLPKDCLGQSDGPLELEMVAVEHGERLDNFEAALETTKSSRQATTEAVSPLKSNLSGSTEDITPRRKPAPHQTKAPTVKPSVPEVSILFDEQSMVFPRSDDSPGMTSPMPPAEADPVPHPLHKVLPNHGISNGRPGPAQAVTTSYNGYPAPHMGAGPVSASPTASYPQGQVFPAGNQPTCGPGYQPRPAQQGQPERPYTPYPGGPYANPQGYTHYPQGPMPQPVHLIPEHMPHPRNVIPRRPAGPPQGYVPGPRGAPLQYGPEHRPSGPVQQSHAPYTMQQRPGMGHPASAAQRHRQHQGDVYTAVNKQYPPANGPAQSRPQRPSSWGSTRGLAAQYMPQPVPQGNGMIQHPAQVHTSQPRPQMNYTNTQKAHVQVPVSSQGVPQTRPHNHHSTETSPVHNSSDSGLHSNDSADSGGHLDQSSASAYSQVPAEVYDRLQEQEQQLQTLRDQLAQLLAKQSWQPSASAPTTSQNHDVKAQPTATDSSVSTIPTKPKTGPNDGNKCTIGINTSIFWPGHESTFNQSQDIHILNATDLVDTSNDSHQDQSAAREYVKQDNQLDNTHCSRPKPKIYRTSMKPSHQPIDHSQPPSSSHTSPQHTDHVTSAGYPHQFPSPINRHEAEGGLLGNETLSLGEIQLAQIQDRTEDSIMSEMVVDMPAYTSMSPDKLGGGSSSGYGDTDESSKSPVLGESVSMYEDQNTQGPGYLTEAGLLVNNQKQFYSNLIGNVNKLLAKHNADETPSGPAETHTTPNCDESHTSVPPHIWDPSSARAAHSGKSHPGTDYHREAYPGAYNSVPEHPLSPDKSINVAELTLKRLKEMGVDVDQCSSSDTSRFYSGDQSCLLDPVLLPKISYMSMMLDSGESDLSQDADALAMKYLSDEQLSVLARQRLNSPRKNKRDPGLDRVMSSDRSRSDVSTYGMNNHMSFASRKYLERYGLSEDEKRKQSDEETQRNKSGADDFEASRGAETLGEHPALADVQEYLRKLNERSFHASPDSSHCTSGYQDPGRNPGGGYRHGHSGNSSTDHSITSDAHLTYHSEESYLTRGPYRGPPAHQGGYHSGSSDITSNRTPDHTPAKCRTRRTTDQGPAANTTPARKQHTQGAASPGPGGDGFPPQTMQRHDLQSEDSHQHAEATKPRPGRVLDIDRLKRLPKLL